MAENEKGDGGSASADELDADAMGVPVASKKPKSKPPLVEKVSTSTRI